MRARTPSRRAQGETATDAEEVDTAIAQFLAEDKSLKAFFDEAHGYADFPNVYKSGPVSVVLMGRAGSIAGESMLAIRNFIS